MLAFLAPTWLSCHAADLSLCCRSEQAGPEVETEQSGTEGSWSVHQHRHVRYGEELLTTTSQTSCSGSSTATTTRSRLDVYWLLLSVSSVSLLSVSLLPVSWLSILLLTEALGTVAHRLLLAAESGQHSLSECDETHYEFPLFCSQF